LFSRPFSLSVLVISEDTVTEKTSKFSLSRLHNSSMHKSSSSSSHRPSTSNGSPQKSPNDFAVYDEKEREKSNTLRKRNSSNSNPNTPTDINANALEGVSGFIKQGLNIMDQIGEPDHTGWMRKRGDRFNSWKSRYFILKGPHLYFLRSNNKSVSYTPPLGFGLNVDFDCRKLESRDMSILLDIRLQLMRMSILGATVSGLIMIMIRRITSARRRRVLFGIG
jgi:hypothetical protein